MGETTKKRKKPSAPKWFSKEATAEWRRVTKLLCDEDKDFTAKDLKALEAYCMSYAKWKACELVLQSKGYTMEVGEDRYVQQRPEVSIANKAQQEVRAWAKELGLTPAARSRMKTAQNTGDGTDPEMEGLIAHD